MREAADERAAPEIVNSLLRDARALPRLVAHGDVGWHLHATEDDAAPARRIAAESALGCGNRANVAAHRARKAQVARNSIGRGEPG